MARKGTKWFLVISLLVALLGGLYGAAFFVAKGGLGVASPADDSFYDTHTEELVEEGSGDEKVAMVNVVGEIFSDPDGGIEGASDRNIIAQLEHAAEDEDVAAIILNLETPGGGVVASDDIYRKVLEVKKQKPVVALMGDVAASGGVYIAVAANEIVAHPATWTGSIGVIAILPNIEAAADKIGVGVTVVKSGALKDAGSPFRAMTPEEQALFQSLVDEAYGQFVDVVATGRKLSVESVRQIADGRIYSGKQAKQNGLVDHLGDDELAFTRAKRLAKAPGASLVRYAPSLGFSDILGVTAQRLGSTNAVREQLDSIGLRRRPGASYLWLP